MKLSKFFLWLFGWKIEGVIPEGEKKAVIIAAPHTSMWDFVFGRLPYFVLDVDVKYLIKSEMFVWPYGRLLRKLGGIPVDRKKSGNTVDQVARLFRESESLYVIITPEGTRALVKNWKRGFYYIAEKAGVPIALGFLDYKKKTGGIGKMLYPSGDFKKDLEIIEDFYKDKSAKHPEKFNLSPMYRNKEE